MTWQEALKEVYSESFSIRLDVVSGLRQLLSAAAEEEAVKSLLSAVKGDKGVALEVMWATLTNSASKAPRDQCNPNDIALTILASILATANMELAQAIRPQLCLVEGTLYLRQFLKLLPSDQPTLVSKTLKVTEDRLKASWHIVSSRGKGVSVSQNPVVQMSSPHRRQAVAKGSSTEVEVRFMRGAVLNMDDSELIGCLSRYSLVNEN